jgi:hypothetical protein
MGEVILQRTWQGRTYALVTAEGDGCSPCCMLRDGGGRPVCVGPVDSRWTGGETRHLCVVHGGWWVELPHGDRGE